MASGGTQVDMEHATGSHDVKVLGSVFSRNKGATAIDEKKQHAETFGRRIR